MLMQPTRYSKDDSAYDLVVGNQTVTPSYDPHCIDDVSGGCFPIEIISAEKLVAVDTGAAESRKIAKVLENRTGSFLKMLGNVSGKNWLSEKRE